MTVLLRSLADLVAEATAAKDPAVVDAGLEAAAAQASGYLDWRAILASFANLVCPLPLARRLALLEKARASAHDRREIWGYHDVAVHQARELGDADSARATLAEARAMLVDLDRTGEAHGYLWGWLATALQLALGDDQAAREALERGWDIAWRDHDVENLGRLAATWSKVGLKEEGVARLQRVEAAARGWGEGKLAGTIYWWNALGDAAASVRVRQAVLDEATRSSEVVSLIDYWTLYDKDSPGIDAAFARAEALAASASDWLELGQASTRRPELRRRALDHAAALATSPDVTPETRTAIAAAYVDWFGDAAAAARAGPRGVRPAGDDATALFDWLRARLSREQLETIAAADYGQGQSKHLAALEHIVATGLVPVRLAWHPGEVVELTRWATEDVDHLARAFACVVVCLGNPDDELANTGAPLVDSCLHLGPEACVRGERFLAWMNQQGRSQEGTSEALVARFALLMLVAGRDPHDPRIDELLRLLAASSVIAGLREVLATSVSAERWVALIDRWLQPLHATRPAISPLLGAIGFPA
jgi:hypothetical protein